MAEQERDSKRLQAEAEKEEKRRLAEQERETKRMLAEIEKAEKDEKKRAAEAEKDEKRRAVEAERESKRRALEQKRLAKEEAVAQKVAEQEKKERSQLRLGNFFTKKTTEVKSVVAVAEDAARQSVFRPFHRKENVIWRTHRTNKGVQVDDLASLSSTVDQAYDVARTLESLRSAGASRAAAVLVRSQARPLRELMRDVSTTPLKDRLKGVRYKLLQYKQDYRPPYWGTMTVQPGVRGLATGRNPYARSSKLNYDYDSEAEWQSDEEGEDLDDDDENSVDSGDSLDEEDRAFLDDSVDGDDDGPGSAPRARQVGQLVPLIAGPYFTNLDVTMYDADEELGRVAKMGMQRLVALDSDEPIDPFRDYWSPPSIKLPAAAARVGAGNPSAAAKQDENEAPTGPRFTAKEKGKARATLINGRPMHQANENALNLLHDPTPQRPAVQALGGSRSAGASAVAAASVTLPPAGAVQAGGKAALAKESSSTAEEEQVPAAIMPAFKAAIDGSTLSKVLLVEMLRAKFGQGSSLFDAVGVDAAANATMGAGQGTGTAAGAGAGLSKKCIERTLTRVAKRAGRGPRDAWVLL